MGKRRLFAWLLFAAAPVMVDRRIIASVCAGEREALGGYARARLFPVEDAAARAEIMKEADA